MQPNADPGTLVADSGLIHCYTAFWNMQSHSADFKCQLKGHGRQDVEAWLEDGLVSSALGTWPGLRQHTLNRAEVQS